jgi:hypothetical protein
MKNIKLYIPILLALTIFSSCDDYLDVKPVDKVIPETIEEFRGIMTQGYESVPKEVSKITFRTDEVKFNTTAWEHLIVNYKDIYFWNDETPVNGTLPFNYLNFYRVIFYANHVIEEGDEASNGTPDEVNQLVGEAYLMRALMHFNLVNQYAVPFNKETAANDTGVPISTKIDLEAKYAPSTVAEVYKQVESDIVKGLDLLNIETYELGKNYRFTKTAGYALQARVALYKKEWDKAFIAAKAAMNINSTLEDLNASEFVLPNKFTSKENIMALEMGLNSGAVGSVFVSDKLIALYDMENDLRISNYYSKSADGNYLVEKGGDDSFMCTFRTAEMYLIAAEAKANMDELDEAKTFLNQLKEARLNPDFYTQEVSRLSGMNKSELIGEIANERFRELSFEGHRWFDLRRTTQEEITHKFNDQTVVLKKGDKRYTLRFPQEAINSNPNLSN